jgi:hypothetical protein
MDLDLRAHALGRGARPARRSTDDLAGPQRIETASETREPAGRVRTRGRESAMLDSTVSTPGERRVHVADRVGGAAPQEGHSGWTWT